MGLDVDKYPGLVAGLKKAAELESIESFGDSTRSIRARLDLNHRNAVESTPDIHADKQDDKKGMSWQQARDAALKYLRTKPWPGSNILAISFIGCSPSTLRKACQKDAQLARFKLDYEQRKKQQVKSVAARQMPDAVLDSVTAIPDQTDDDMDVKTFSADESDKLIDRLKAECKTEESVKQFDAMTEYQRLRVAIQAFSDPDTGRDTRPRGGRVRTR